MFIKYIENIQNELNVNKMYKPVYEQMSPLYIFSIYFMDIL